jgi:hypothetical protein
MTEETQRQWDILIKIVALIGSAAAIYGYFDKKETEFRKPLWDEQLKLYFEATDTVSKIANSPEGPERDNAIRKYWQLSYGSMRIVEDSDNVSNAMVAVGACLVRKCNQSTLQNLSLDLADACRRSIAETWSEKFADYKADVEKRNSSHNAKELK